MRPSLFAMATDAHAKNTAWAGILMMLLAMSLIPMNDAISKIMTERYAPIQVSWMRFGAQLMLVAPPVLYLHGAAALRPPMFKLQLARGLMLAFASLFFVSALSAMPIADAMAVVFVFPLMVAALSPWLLGEHNDLRRWMAVIIGFGGALLIIRPGASGVSQGALFALGAACCFAGYAITTRKLSGAGAPLIMLFFGGLCGFAALGVMMPFIWAPVRPEDIWWVLAMGGLNAAAHLCMILAYQWGEAGLISPFSYFQIVGGVLMGWLVFGDLPDPIVALGVLIIIGSGIYIALQKPRGAQG